MPKLPKKTYCYSNPTPTTAKPHSTIFPTLFALILLLILPQPTLSQATSTSLPSSVLGLYSWKYSLHQITLIIDYSGLPALNGGNRESIVKTRSTVGGGVGISLIDPSSGAKTSSYALVARGVQNEGNMGRASFVVWPTAATGAAGVDLTLQIIQPVSRRRRALVAYSTQSKTISVPTILPYSTPSSHLSYLLFFHSLSYIHWIVTAFTILIHPVIPPIGLDRGWLGVYSMYFQYASTILSLSSVYFYNDTDYIFQLLDLSQWRILGADINFISTVEQRRARMAVDLGKMSRGYARPLASVSEITSKDYVPDAVDVLILGEVFPLCLIYIVAALASLAPHDGIRRYFSGVRIGTGVCWGVAMVSRTISSWMYWVNSDIGGAKELTSVIIGSIVVGIMAFDCAILKVQTMKLTTFGFYTLPDYKGAHYFDILGYSNHRIYKDFYPFFLGEYEVILICTALFVGFTFEEITQTTILACGSILCIVSIVLLNQSSIIKWMKVGFHGLVLCFVTIAYVCQFSRQTSIENAKTLALIVLIIGLMMLAYNLVMLFYRVYALVFDPKSKIVYHKYNMPPLVVPPPKGSKTSGVTQNKLLSDKPINVQQTQSQAQTANKNMTASQTLNPTANQILDQRLTQVPNQSINPPTINNNHQFANQKSILNSSQILNQSNNQSIAQSAHSQYASIQPQQTIQPFNNPYSQPAPQQPQQQLPQQVVQNPQTQATGGAQAPTQHNFSQAFNWQGPSTHSVYSRPLSAHSVNNISNDLDTSKQSLIPY